MPCQPGSTYQVSFAYPWQCLQAKLSVPSAAATSAGPESANESEAVEPADGSAAAGRAAKQADRAAEEAANGDDAHVLGTADVSPEKQVTHVILGDHHQNAAIQT